MSKTNGGKAWLSLEGMEGMLAGQKFGIEMGRSVVVGRSRKCEISTRRSRRFKEASEAQQRRILKTPSFLKVSRRHVRISHLAPGRVEVWDLSKNGTFIDGRRVDRVMLEGLDASGVELRLASTERLRLSTAHN